MAAKNERCTQYTGVACIDGTCPMANKEEYEERCIPTIKSCKECHYNEGCKDCYFDRTEYCVKSKENKKL